MSSGSLRNGPSFKALLISSLLIVAAGSGALAVSMTGLLQDRGDGSRTVETLSITAEPTIESLIAGSDGVSSGGSTAGETAAGEIDTAKAQAKAQIRKVFAARDPNASASVNQAAAVADTAQDPSPDKIQARVEPRQAGEAGNTLSEAGATGSALAQTGQTGAAVPAAGEISTASEQSETGIETLPGDPAYTNTGLVSVAVNLRQTADNDSEVLTVVPENSEVRFSECGPWWCNISYEGQSGFISQKYLQR
ncbi:SH3 domain-containing protein [Roseibium salinum]|uniref:SH3 domain-containing protein n=1 Tax=Roseibium salinum TaxID=1604349 RepID=UPI00361C306A